MRKSNLGKSGVFGKGHFLRPIFIQPYRCKNVSIEGVTIINSPMWEIHPMLCTNVTVRGLTVNSLGRNNDGCDSESCRDVLIEDCSIATDDCIAIKPGRNNDGRRIGVPADFLQPDNPVPDLANCLRTNDKPSSTIDVCPEGKMPGRVQRNRRLKNRRRISFTASPMSATRLSEFFWCQTKVLPHQP